MRPLLVLFGILLLSQLSISQLTAQEQDSMDWDIDTIFDLPLEDSQAETDNEKPAAEETKPAGQEASVIQTLHQRGYSFNASYLLQFGFLPGWINRPWDDDWDSEAYYLDRAVRMRSTFGIDARISEVFSVRSVVYFEIPVFRFNLGNFYFDYNFFDTVFFRGGKYSQSWGISPNFGFTNLLARIPKGGSSSDSFIFKADLPIGTGGLQALALTRANLVNSSSLVKLNEFGFGGKYNLAQRHADFDLGVFYQEAMPLRAFLSAKTTILDTEVYNEWLIAVDLEDPSSTNGAVNIGFEREFFNRKFNVNGELFYNAEKETYWYEPGSSIRDASTNLFVEGFNIALNLLYRPGWKGNPRIFLRTLYAPMQESLQLIPGFRLSPLRHIELYFATPMALGSRDGFYYANTVRKDNAGQPLPFSVMLLLTLSGSVQAGHY